MARPKEPFKPYTFQPYPAHRYGPDGVVRVVNSADEDAAAQDEGFEDHPTKVGKAKEIEIPMPRGGKKPKAKETPLEKAIEKAIEAKGAAFDRKTAIATLEAANFDIDPDTTDEELVEALAELAK